MNVSNKTLNHPIDIFIGKKLQSRRKALALTQEDLSNKLAIPQEIIEKYENGEERIGGKRLYDFAAVLDVQPPYFFNGITKEKDIVLFLENSKVTDPNMFLMMQAFKKIGHTHFKKNLLDLINAITKSETQEHLQLISPNIH